MRSLYVKFTGPFARYSVLTGKVVSATLNWEMHIYFWQWSVFSHLCDDTWDIRSSLTEAGTGIWGSLFR